MRARELEQAGLTSPEVALPALLVAHDPEPARSTAAAPVPGETEDGTVVMLGLTC